MSQRQSATPMPRRAAISLTRRGTADGMNAALRSGALDIVGLARLPAIDPDAPAALLKGRDSPHRVRPIRTGIKAVDRMGVMEVLWYTLQLGRIAGGGNPRPNESGLMALLKSLMKSNWGNFRTRRLRAQSNAGVVESLASQK